MMSDVGKLIHFRDLKNGEDLDWAIRLVRSGFLTNEYISNHDRIHYIYNIPTRELSPNTLKKQEDMNYVDMLNLFLNPISPASKNAPRTNIPVLRLTSRGFVSK
jgi:hypothetical protein